MMNRCGELRNNSNLLLMLCLVLFCYSVLVYSGTAANEFVWDSYGVFVESPQIDEIFNYKTLFQEYRVGDKTHAVDVGGVVYYRPLLVMIHAIEHQLFGINPLWYNIVNIFSNGILVILLFLMAIKMIGNVKICFLSSLLYASMPARTEVVSWAYSDSHIFLSIIVVLSIISFLNNNNKTCAALFVVGLLIQEGAVIIPLLLLAVDAFYLNNFKFYKNKIYYVLALIGSFYVFARYLLFGSLLKSDLSLVERLNGAVYVIAKYIKIMFVPDGPVTVYPYVPGMFSSLGMRGSLAYGILGVLVVVGIIIWKKRNDLFFWYAWTFVFLSLSVSIGIAGDYYMAEKAIYLSSFGLCVVVVSFISSILIGKILYAAVILIVIINSVLILERNKYWLDTKAYLTGIIKYEKNFALGHAALGSYYSITGDFSAAISAYRDAYYLVPGNENVKTSLLSNYEKQAREYADKGRYQDAINILNEAIKYDSKNSSILNSLGICHYLNNNSEKAREYWQMAIAYDSKNTEALMNLRLLDK